MRKTHTPEQIIDTLRQVERETNQGKTAAEACRTLGISEWSFYRWRQKFGQVFGELQQVTKASRQGAAAACPTTGYRSANSSSR